MNKKYCEEIIGKIVFFIIGLYVLIKIFIPIIYPASLASGLYDKYEVYKRILDKSNAYIETIMDYNDFEEDKKELISIIFKYLTDIDISDPRTYLTSQIPMFQLIDITSLISKESGPVVVVPNVAQQDVENESDSENEQNNNNSTNNSVNNSAQDDKTQQNNNSDSPLKVKLGNIKPIKKMKLDPKKPLVLIYHTHTTENYNPQNRTNEDYTTDPNKGVCRLGEEIKNELQNVYGIATIHDTTVHDLPKREGAYAKSRPTVQKYVKQYSSLKIIIDLHRDGNVNINKTTAIISNERYARVMFVVGTNNKNHSKSELMAKKINDVFESLYPNFSRGLMFKKGIYNQDVSSKIILLEVGSDGNSLEEALRSAKVIGRVIAQCLN
ncbi:hypothetical protein FDN13_01175 [Caloramator sp. E03]|uniref:stage II sporulation protein P n=1 Tax=Caloramator sp. E03 TaxID=2576307 RepID=UPI0011106579|nr:stage II sporulation protein P [Caloramator sp. E03]QCX32420.1 hypothetical protein FDN13_01175 [Caloramator sp. E03]